MYREAGRQEDLDRLRSYSNQFHFNGTFRQWAANYFPHYLTKNPSEFHEWLAETLGDFHRVRGRRQVVKAPRGNAKTVWSTNTYPLYAACEGFEKFTILGGDTSEQSNLYLNSLRSEILTNDALRRDYGDVISRAKHREGRIVLGNGCCIEECSTGGPILGRKHGAYRPSLIIGDDLQKRKNIHSPLQRQRSLEWLMKDAIKAGNTGTNVLILGTALHREAIVCQLDVQPGWSSRTWKSIIDWPERMDLWSEWGDIWRDWDRPDRAEAARAFYDDRRGDMDAGHKVLWPAEEDLYTLMLKRLTEGEAAFESENQNSPHDPSLSAWPPEYFDWPGIWWDGRLPPDVTGKVISLDPSLGKDAQAGDRWAIGIMAQNSAGVMYHDTVAERGGGTERMLQTMCVKIRDFRPEAIMIETLCFQELLKEPLARIAKSMEIDLPRIIKDEDVTNKDLRIHRVGPSWSQRRIRLRKNSPGVALLLSEARDFSNGTTDDILDALEKCHRFFNKSKLNFSLR